MWREEEAGRQFVSATFLGDEAVSDRWFRQSFQPANEGRGGAIEAQAACCPTYFVTAGVVSVRCMGCSEILGRPPPLLTEHRSAIRANIEVFAMLTERESAICRFLCHKPLLNDN